MTTIVAVRKNGIVAIAADTLTTFGNTRLHASQDGSHDKILKIGESYVGVCGSAAHHLVLANLLAKSPEVQLNSKAAIFETFRKLHPILKEECFLNPKEDEDDPYESSQITALIANSSGIYGIYSMREVFEYTQYWAIGSGMNFRWGPCITRIRLMWMRSVLLGQVLRRVSHMTRTVQHLSRSTVYRSSNKDLQDIFKAFLIF